MVTAAERARNKQYHLSLYYRVKQQMHEHLGGKCAECGAIENLDIHHKDRSSKKFTLTNRWGWPWEKLVEELNKCELRCKAHHIKIHEAKHGTASRYINHNCRCVDCKAAKALSMKEYFARKKRD